MRTLIEGAGCRLLLLPPYSPDFASIEQVFSKVKAYLRGVGPRTRDQLEAAISAALRLVTPADAHGWFQQCGSFLDPGHYLCEPL